MIHFPYATNPFIGVVQYKVPSARLPASRRRRLGREPRSAASGDLFDLKNALSPERVIEPLSIRRPARHDAAHEIARIAAAGIHEPLASDAALGDDERDLIARRRPHRDPNRHAGISRR